MAELCPIEPGGGASSWGQGIPQACYEQCSALWDEATQNQQPYIDTFSTACEDSGNEQCGHPVEYGGDALQRPHDSSDPRRDYSMNYECSATTEELFSEQYSFVCPFNDPSFPPRINFLS